MGENLLYFSVASRNRVAENSRSEQIRHGRDVDRIGGFHFVKYYQCPFISDLDDYTLTGAAGA